LNRTRGEAILTTKLLALTAFGLFSLLFVGDCWGHKVEVQVLGFSEVPANRPVRLGLFALPIADPESKFENVQDVEIFDPGKPGDRRFLGRVEIVRAIQDKISSDEFTFRIPNQMILETKKNLIARFDIERELLSEVQKQCGECEVRLRDLKVPRLNMISEDLISWSLDASQTKLQGSFVIPLKAQFSSGTQNFLVTATASIFKSALVTRRMITAGERIGEADLEMKKVDVTFLKGSLLTNIEAKGQLAARYLVAGQTVLSGDIKREPAALRGQLMKVIAGNEDLEVTTQALAEEAGFVGDLIKLKNTETQKFISGKILEKGVVKLQ
jgi:flagellar basal body P-ring formation protein FlgA